MSELVVVAAGSIAGVFTALAADKSSWRAASSRENFGGDNDGSHPVHLDESSMESDHATTTTPALEKRLVYRAIKRVYDYERAGRITSHERDRLLARYRGELDQMNTFTAVTSPAPGGADNNNMSLFKRDLITILDQRIAQIGAGIDDLKKSIENGPAPRRVPDLDVGEEEKEEKKIDAAGSAKTVKKQKENEKEDTSTVHVPQKSDPLPAVDSVESSEGDSSLEDIKKQIMQTLSRLEQAEVE